MKTIFPLKISLFLFILTASLNELSAQTLEWVGAIAGGQHNIEPNTITTDPNGDILVGGTFRETVDLDLGVGVATYTSPSNRDGFVGKYNSAGDLIWSFSIGATTSSLGLDTRVYDVVTDNVGNVIVVGEFRGTAINFAPLGGVTTTLTSGNSGSVSSGFVAKYSSIGECIWAFGLGGSNSNNELYTVGVDANNNIYIGGRLDDNLGSLDINPLGTSQILDTNGADAVLIKYSENGIYVWDVNIGNPNNNDYAYGIEILNSKLYLTGEFQGTCEFNTNGTSIQYTSLGSFDGYIAEYNIDTGICNWANQIGGTSGDESRKSATDSNGNIYVTGSFSSTVDFDPSAGISNITSNGGTDIFVVKYTPSGVHEWSFSIGDSSSDIGYDIDVDDSNVYVTGKFRGTADFDPSSNVANITGQGGSTKDEIYLAKYGTNGNYINAFAIEGTDNDRGQGLSVNSGNVYLTGYFEDDDVDFDPVGTNTLSSLGGTIYHDGFIASYNDQDLAPKIAILEWLTNPTGTEIESEWIEIYNYGSSTVNLKDWKLKDEDTDDVVISTIDLYLDPDEYLILANDKTKFEELWLKGCQNDKVIQVAIELDNEADEIILENDEGSVIWSVAYQDDETEGRATQLTDLDFVNTTYGDKANPGVSRTGNDVTGELGYQSNNITVDTNAYISFLKEEGSPLHEELVDRNRGNAIYLDGTDDYINLGATTEIENQSMFTFETWIKPISIGSDGEMKERIFSKRLSNTHRIEIILGNELLEIIVSNGFGINSFSPDSSVPLLEWTHIAVTFDGTAALGNRLKFYANGISLPLTSDPVATQTPFGLGDAHIGKRSTSSNMAANIELDEIRLWNTKRSQQEVRNNMHLTLMGCEAGLISYYQLNETTGTIAEDHQGTNQAILVNGATRYTSPINVGNSFSSLAQSIANISSIGNVSFDSTHLDINMTEVSNSQDITVTYQSFIPNSIEGIEGVLVYDSVMWTINGFPENTEFVGDLKFTFPSNTFSDVDHLKYRLYHRTSNSIDQWQDIAIASSIVNDTITFSNIEVLGQFMVVKVTTDEVSPVRGNMYSFDGVDDYIDLGNDAEFDISDAITIECWIKMNSTTGNQTIVSKSDDASMDNSYTLKTINGVPQFSVSIGSTWLSVNAGTPLISNEWHHVTGVYDGTSMIIYVDGIAQNSIAQTGEIDLSTSTTTIGGASVGEHWDGALEEVRIWNVARSQTEIRANIHLTLNGNETNLSAYYQFNIDDIAGNSEGVKDGLGLNNGTATNMDIAAYLPSEVPVAGGKSVATIVPANGPFIMFLPDVGIKAEFGAGSNMPDGELVAYRLETESPTGANSIAGEADDEYFIIRNYGTNSSFSILDSLSLLNIGYIDPIDAALPESTSPLVVYKRPSNSFGSSWGSLLASAHSAKAGHNGSISVDNSAAITNFGQFVFAKDGFLCDLAISSNSVIHESCPDSGDGKIIVSAVCPSCEGTIEYSKDNGATYQVSNEFTNLVDGVYNIVIRDTGNITCTASETLSINQGTNNISWNGSAGDGLWTNAGNWSSNVVPNTCHNVTISNGDMVTLSGITTSINSLMTSNNSKLTVTSGASLTLISQ